MKTLILFIILFVTSLYGQNEWWYFYDDVDITALASPINLAAVGRANAIDVTWTASVSSDVAGVIVYRDSLGSDLYLVHGDFTDAVDTLWWTYNAALTFTGGVCHYTSVTHGTGLYTNDLLTVGKSYIITLTISNCSAGGIRFYNGGHLPTVGFTANATYSYTFTASDTEFEINAYGTSTLDLDNITIKEIITSTSYPDNPIDTVLAGTNAYVDTILTAGTVYSYRIKAFDASYNYSAYTASVSDTCLPVTPVIVATNTDATWRNTITHSPIIADSIRIYKGTSANPTTWVASISSADASSFVDSNLTEGTTYWYRAKALTGSTFSSYSANDSSIINMIAPSAPTNLVVTGKAIRDSLVWVDPTDTDLDSIRIYRTIYGGSSTYYWLSTVLKARQYYVDSSLTADSIYGYKLYAVDALDNISAASSAASDTALPILCAVDLDGSTEYMSKTSPANLDLNGAERITTAARNSTFEDNATDFATNGTHSIATSTTQKYAGTYSGKVIGTAVGDTTTNFISLAYDKFTPLVVGEKYTVEYRANADSTGNGWATKPKITMKIGSKQWGGTATDTISIYPGLWKKFVYNFQATSAEVNTPIKFYLSQADTCYVDNFSITQAYDISKWVWVKTSNTGVTKQIIQRYDGTTVKGIRMYIASANYLRVAIADHSGVVYTVDGVTNICNNNWHLVGVTINRIGNLQLYVDGIAEGIATSITDIGNINSTTTFMVGFWSTDYFNGYIGEIQRSRFTDITNATYTPSQIYYHGKAGYNFYSSNGGTVVSWYKFAGATDGAFLDDASSSANDLTGTNCTQAGDQVIISGY